MSERQIVTIDGNEAAAYVAHKTNEVIAIYPITPSSNMGEWADAWSAENRKNIWGTVPLVVEMQIGRRRGRRSARRAADRRADHHLHRVAGPPADDPQHVQDRRRADLDGLPHRGPCARHACAVDLRRPQRRDGVPLDRLGHALLQQPAGGDGPGADRPGRHAEIPRAVPALLRRLPHQPRDPQDRRAGRRRHPRHDRRQPGAGAPAAGAQPRASRHPRHRAEPRRLLPGARGGQFVLPGRPRDRPGGDGQVRRHRRPPVQAVRLRRRAGCRARDRADGLQRRHRARGGQRARPRPARRSASSRCASIAPSASST